MAPRLRFLVYWLYFSLLSWLALPANSAQSIRMVIAEDVGITRRGASVTCGVPFPEGALRKNDRLRLLDEKGSEVPLQVATTATWRDGSVKWLLLDFITDLEQRLSRSFDLQFGQSVLATVKGPSIQIEQDADALWINTGPLRFSIARNRFGIFEETFLDKNRDGVFELNEALVARLAPVAHVSQ
jgi:hypothetical protein